MGPLLTGQDHPASLAPGGGRAGKSLGAPARPRGSILKWSVQGCCSRCPRSIARRTGATGSSRQPSGHTLPRWQVDRGGPRWLSLQEALLPGELRGSSVCLMPRPPTWRQDQCCQGTLLPGFQQVPRGSASYESLEIHPRATPGLWGQEGCWCRAAAHWSLPQVTWPGSPWGALPLLLLVEPLEPSPQRLCTSSELGDSNLRGGGADRTPGVGTGAKELMGAWQRLLFQAVPQGQRCRPHPS